jgi:hypothetical protein
MTLLRTYYTNKFFFLFHPYKHGKFEGRTTGQNLVTAVSAQALTVFGKILVYRSIADLYEDHIKLA